MYMYMGDTMVYSPIYCVHIRRHHIISTPSPQVGRGGDGKSFCVI